MRGTSHVEKCERHVLLRMRVSREVKSWGYVDLEHECIISWVKIREWRRQSDAEHGQLIGTVMLSVYQVYSVIVIFPEFFCKMK